MLRFSWQDSAALFYAPSSGHGRSDRQHPRSVRAGRNTLRRALADVSGHFGVTRELPFNSHLPRVCQNPVMVMCLAILFSITAPVSIWMLGDSEISTREGMQFYSIVTKIIFDTPSASRIADPETQPPASAYFVSIRTTADIPGIN